MKQTVALVGNPNVGKSTVFNALTGLKQHTGNWPGKTVTFAEGEYTYLHETYSLIDLPGTYSLYPHSKEEEVTRDFICFQHPDVILVVCDATLLERNLNLVLQTLELTPNVILCLNLLDEAHKKHLDIHTEKLSNLLGIPVIGTNATKKEGLETLKIEIAQAVHTSNTPMAFYPTYPKPIEDALSKLIPYLPSWLLQGMSNRFLALKLLEKEDQFIQFVKKQLNGTTDYETFFTLLAELDQRLITEIGSLNTLQDQLTSLRIKQAEEIAKAVVLYSCPTQMDRDRRIDQVLTGKYTGFPIMLLLLAFILWITLIGANYPSNILFTTFARIESYLYSLFLTLCFPPWLCDLLLSGIYRVLTWVISVMLPPMAIFFPLFTLLEDSGYLPRIAFNLDYPLKKCHACGKQALTMCMGLGCNAVGVEGCRIIDSPREQLIASLTNSLMPCNGRFPTLILLISLFFVPSSFSLVGTLLSAIGLAITLLIALGVTLLSSWLLSRTLLKGLPSSFALELPPYRKPQIGQVLIRSLLDRTLYVLRRAICVAAPAGLVIWILAHISFHNVSLLTYMTQWLDPFARCFGLDGVILTAFILGFPANEVILPIIIMTYMMSGSITPLDQPVEIYNILVAHQWNLTTAVCTFIFFLMHWPCSTTILTLYKESKSLKWTIIAFLLPTCWGLVLCFVMARIGALFW